MANADGTKSGGVSLPRRKLSAKEQRQLLEQIQAAGEAKRKAALAGRSFSGESSGLNDLLNNLLQAGFAGPALTFAAGQAGSSGSKMDSDRAKRALQQSLGEAKRQQQQIFNAKLASITGGGGGGGGGGPRQAAPGGVSGVDINQLIRTRAGAGGGGGGGSVGPRSISSGGISGPFKPSISRLQRQREQDETNQRASDMRVREQRDLLRAESENRRQELKDRLSLIGGLIGKRGSGGDSLTNTREELVNVAGGIEKRTLRGDQEIDRTAQILNLLT